MDSDPTSGYNKAISALSGQPYYDRRNQLASQVQEGIEHPMRRAAEWKLAQHMYRALFDCRRVAYVILPVGRHPRIPWVTVPPAMAPMSSGDLITLLKREGYEVTGGGKARTSS